MKAYCFASGQIEIGKRVPNGALPLPVRGSRKEIEAAISAKARLAYDNKTWLVPGVPEAPNQTAALDALLRFCDRFASAAVAVSPR